MRNDMSDLTSSGSRRFGQKTSAPAIVGTVLGRDFKLEERVAPAVITLQNGVPVYNLAGALNSQQVFKLTVPAGVSKVDFKITGGTGNADLYVKKGSAPTTTSYDQFLDKGGN